MLWLLFRVELGTGIYKGFSRRFQLYKGCKDLVEPCDLSPQSVLSSYGSFLKSALSHSVLCTLDGQITSYCGGRGLGSMSGFGENGGVRLGLKMSLPRAVCSYKKRGL